MDEDILDLGRGDLLIGELDTVDLSNLETLLIGLEQSDTNEIEIDTTN